MSEQAQGSKIVELIAAMVAEWRSKKAHIYSSENAERKNEGWLR